MRKIASILLILFITVIGVLGCNKEDKLNKTIDEFNKNLNSRKFEKLYELISKENQKYISKEEFTNRYNKIYNSIDVKNIKIKVNEIDENSDAKASMQINTIAGVIKSDNLQINLVKEGGKYKIFWNESLILPNMKKGDIVRIKNIEAIRGKILDKDNNELATNSNVYSLYIHPEVFKKQEKSNVEKVATTLDISNEYIENVIKDKPLNQQIFLLKVPLYKGEIVDKIREIDGVVVKEEVSRVYKNSEAFGNLIGYIGNISKEELDKNENKGYTKNSKIGKNGLEQIYEEKLKAVDGLEIYLERGDEKVEILKKDPINGKDIKLSIDSNLQESIYNEMKNDKGASIAIDPKTGEVLAMVSSPSYNSNDLVTYKSKQVSKTWEDKDNDQFQNKANNAYSPGSTMKLITASIGLEKGVIDPEEYMQINGLDWQKSSSWGEYKVSRVKDTNGPVNLYNAVKYSDNIYFADKSIKIGEKDYIDGLKKYGIGEKIPFEYPMQKSQISNNNKLDKEILLADTGYGQGEVLMTPLDVVLSYSALVNDGNIMVPRLVISENKEAKVYKNAIDKNYIEQLKKCFKGAVNDDDSSGHLGKIDGKEMLGKTGTAEMKKSKNDLDGVENGWFVSVDNNCEIAISMIIEDLQKPTGEYVVPKVKNIVQNYLKK